MKYYTYYIGILLALSTYNILSEENKSEFQIETLTNKENFPTYFSKELIEIDIYFKNNIQHSLKKLSNLIKRRWHDGILWVPTMGSVELLLGMLIAMGTGGQASPNINLFALTEAPFVFKTMKKDLSYAKEAERATRNMLDKLLKEETNNIVTMIKKIPQLDSLSQHLLLIKTNIEVFSKGAQNSKWAINGARESRKKTIKHLLEFTKNLHKRVLTLKADLEQYVTSQKLSEETPEEQKGVATETIKATEVPTIVSEISIADALATTAATVEAMLPESAVQREQVEMNEGVMVGGER